MIDQKKLKMGILAQTLKTEVTRSQEEAIQNIFKAYLNIFLQYDESNRHWELMSANVQSRPPTYQGLCISGYALKILNKDPGYGSPVYQIQVLFAALSF